MILGVLGGESKAVYRLLALGYRVVQSSVWFGKVDLLTDLIQP